MAKPKQESKRGGLERRLPLFASCFIVLLFLVVLDQGGFYADACAPFAIAFILLAVLSAIPCIHTGIPWRLPVCGLLFLVVGLAGIVSGCVHGGTFFEQLIACCPWFMAAAAACVSANFPERERDACRVLLGWAGVVSAVLGILMMAGIVEWSGSVSANRLNFTFQYANTAGVWFGACALAGLFSSSKALRIASVLPVVALLLTRSVGAIALFVIAAAVLAVLAFRQADGKTRRLIIVCFAVGAVAVLGVLVWFLVSGRIEQAGGTFAERVFQMRDALVLFAQNPVWGLGPDGWRDAYEAVRSADYVSTVVHCGYLQVALDTGAFGLIALIAALVVGFAFALKRHDALSAAVIALLAAHSLIDFDIRFGAVLVLLAFFLDAPALGLKRR